MANRMLLVDASSVRGSNEGVSRLGLPLCDVFGLVDGYPASIVKYDKGDGFGINIELFL